ncbi:hypothetical protein LguiA_022643 [Lonicera macranthoides]
MMISFTYKTAFIYSIFFCIISACSTLNSCGRFSSYTSTFFLCEGQTIASNGEMKFMLGFFTPKGNFNKSKYVGIWYLEDPETVVWVANRDKPLPGNSNGSFGVLHRGGNLQLLDENFDSYFSTGLNPPQRNPRTARLLDNGNLVLIDRWSGNILWQSFDNPTDTFLPGMKMSENLKLISWKSRDDPSSGNFSFKQEKDGSYVIMNGTVKHWKSGDGLRNFPIDKMKMYDLAVNLLKNYNPPKIEVTNKRPYYRELNVSSNLNFNKTRLLMSSSGDIEYLRWDSKKKNWLKIWSAPQTRCSVYNACGEFGYCKDESGFTCKCLQGFEPAVPESWNFGDYYGGCSRNSTFCGKETNNTFLLLNVIKVEDADSPYDQGDSEDKCKDGCLADCQCQAYAYRNETGRSPSETKNGCYIWTSELVDLQQESNAIKVYVKIANSVAGASELNQSKGAPPPQNNPLSRRPPQNNPLSRRPPPQNNPLSRRVVIILISSLIAGILLLCSISYIYYRRMVAKRQESRKDVKENTMLGSHRPPRRQFSEQDKKNIDVPFFDLETILAATDSFSDAKKLGQGGFGPVYKGMFPGGQEIAVKRLSVNSMQGLKELKNEVVLIAKLQHRNLVRLLGYCIEGDENILLYEYMPNKSLDAFIFDQTLCVLDWEKRFVIISGIARGLLYLHEDSRLRVIHRDLKASNILLDEDMNPKISDFGLARIVGGKETEANTNRVVGTYGYMSPEYALDGLFSIKSDVFSFGVVVLEIISGKRNTGFYKAQYDLNLLGYAWRFWEEDRPLGMVDQTIVEFCNKTEVLKCIIIGLLCVQEDPGDRPTMSNIVFMLGSEFENLPRPKQPAFVARTNKQIISSDEVTVSTVTGR